MIASVQRSYSDLFRERMKTIAFQKRKRAMELAKSSVFPRPWPEMKRTKMAEPSTIARPYAEAAFRLADAQGKLAEWSAMLANLSAVAADARIRAAIGDPNVPAAKVAGLFISVLAGKLTAEAENFVRVLAENGRLDVLAEIRTQYEALKNEREGTVEAEVYTAFDMDQAQLADLVSRLEKKTGRKVKARVSLDKSLIGGVKIVIGDQVIDGSARAQLGALESALKA